MKLNKLSLKDKDKFCRHLNLARHDLSVYAFTNIYIWKALFDIRWLVIKDSLCIFFQDKIGTFLYLPPLAKKKNPEVMHTAFKIMDSFNKNKAVSRIENIEAKDLPFYRNLGYICQEKFPEYLCLRRELAALRGNKFKSQRAGLNYFTKHYEFEYLPLSLNQRASCLRLYQQWANERRVKIPDPVYQGMLLDSQKSLRIALGHYADLGFSGRAVKVDGRIRAFTFGFKLNKETFCVLYEITDLTIKGLAQFIFTHFCADLKGYRYINIMDDSGLENLKRVKMSYHPLKLIPAYIATRRHA